MLSQASLDFLRDLAQNNNREWFHENKKRYEKDLKKPFQNQVQTLINVFQQHDPEIQIEPKQAIFRINRDTRFSKDKTPYKTNVAAIISKEGRKGKEYPGFYFHFEFGMLMMGGGAYFLEKDALQRVREQIVQQPERFESIVTDANFIKHYEELKGEKNKRLPKEFKAFAERQPLIANKQYYAMAELDPKLVLQDDFPAIAESYFKALQPLNQFLAEAITP